MVNMFKTIEGINIVLSNKRYVATFAVMAIFASIAYSMLFESSLLNLSAQKIAFGLDAYALTASAALGIMLSLSIVLNIFAFSRGNTNHVDKASIGAVITSIAPLTLCCSTIVPSILAVAGIGASTVISTTGVIQGPLAEYEPLLIGISFVLLALSVYITSTKIAKNCECCVIKR